MPIVEKRYAQALLSSSKSKEDISLFENGLRDVAELFARNNQFKKVMLDPRISSDIKVNIVRELFPEYENKLFISFISLLMDKHRIDTIEGISKEYSELNRILNNEIKIKIVAATNLEDDEIEAIKNKYKKLYNVANVSYDFAVDEDVLGGVKVIVGNKVYDGTLKTQLQKMF